ncbi:phosphoglycolate phosphatase [Salinihabitans flavidus]|uniref:Phosphoglycolate phosphatase n=1 Tax=Salinihabitans flavidus TaxID=569882 RepID=A0A1H8VJD1_9RHOB|nr:HAD-IA family hydrolase [Salinihabitans flavidus]SEP15536.1 phosphoglycolate phosphatase [Salinihabitans flavidus]
MSDLRLVVFDVDGTLVDSQGDILAAMGMAFGGLGLPVPARETVLGIVGLSLDAAMPRLALHADGSVHARLAEGYKTSYMQLRAEAGVERSSPLYPGARDALERLAARPEVILGVATGKSQRGLDKLLEGHGLERMFLTRQVADHHPSKPHPSMLLAAMAEVGATPEQTVMIGDTSYDMEMARAAGIPAIGVSWGYHDRTELTAAHSVIDAFEALDAALADVLRVGA